MAKDWKSELKEIINSKLGRVKKVIDDRDGREKERLKKIKEIKNIIIPRLQFVKELFEKEKYLISTIEPARPDQLKTEGTKAGIANEVQAQGVVNRVSVSGDKSSAFLEACRRGERVAVPIIKEGEAELVLFMPELSDVNRLDLMYKIELKDGKLVLNAYDLLSAGKIKNNGSAHDKFEEFIQDTMKRFLLSWFTRKESTELDLERRLELRIEGHALKP